MRSAIALSLILAFGAGAQAQEKKFTSQDGRFKATFPTAKVMENEQDVGGITLYSFGTESRGRAFLVMYMDFPIVIKGNMVKELFDGTQEGAAKEGDGKLLSSINTTFGPKKLPAREILIKNDEKIIRTLLVLDGKRMYMIMAGGMDSFTTNKEAFAFFESFEITK
ncbi:MAG: hypothetical protein L0241_22205 [Planctomycetia bacterium]|nr:hypothetical protein [Planctomycetia bacterium]